MSEVRLPLRQGGDALRQLAPGPAAGLQPPWGSTPKWWCQGRSARATELVCGPSRRLCRAVCPSPKGWPVRRPICSTPLDDEQRAIVTWPFPSDEERRRWFYTPVDHGGLPLGEMRPRPAATGDAPALYWPVVGEGFVTGVDDRRAWRTCSTRSRLEWACSGSAKCCRDPGLYYVRIFGQPPADGELGWRFGGHHGRHHTIVDGEAASSTPCFLGANPGVVDAPRATPAAPARRRRGPRPPLVWSFYDEQFAQGVDLAGGARRPGHHEPPRRRPRPRQRRPRRRAGQRPRRRPAGGPARPARRLRAPHPRRPRRHVNSSIRNR